MYFISHPHHFIDFPRQRPFSHDDEYSHRPRNEASKKQSYGKRVKEVEGGLSPHWTLVMNTALGIANQFQKVLRTLSTTISKRTQEPYSEVIAHLSLRTRLRFSLLQTCLIAVRGNRRKIAISSLVNTELVT